MVLDVGDGILVEVFCGLDENGRLKFFFYYINERYFYVIEILLNIVDLFWVSFFIYWLYLGKDWLLIDRNKSLIRKVLFLILDSELMRDYFFCFWVNVCCGFNDVLIIMILICGVGKKNELINGDNIKF